MFPPASLLSPACAPREFDFYTASIEDLLDFEIPIDFVVGRTGLIHGVCPSLPPLPPHPLLPLFHSFLSSSFLLAQGKQKLKDSSHHGSTSTSPPAHHHQHPRPPLKKPPRGTIPSILPRMPGRGWEIIWCRPRTRSIPVRHRRRRGAGWR